MRFSMLMVLLLLMISCKNKESAQGQHPDHDVYYTCSMHPQVVASKPGKCPICGMALIQVRHSKEHKAGEIRLSDEQVQLGNITVDTIRNGSLSNELVLTATLNFDESAVNAVSARVGGRVERLYFRNTGDFVKRGDKLFDLYSDELNAAKQEYLLAISQQAELGNAMVDYRQLVQAARNKLLLWGVSEEQITTMAQNRKPGSITTFYSASSGYITTLAVNEGDYVMDGSPILKLASLSTLWAEAQVYTSQLSDIDRNSMALVQIPDLGNKEIAGHMELVNPEVSPDTRINLIRVSIPNPGGALRPGMPAYVIIRDPTRHMLTLPADAVIRDSKGASVWMQTGKHTFASRMVKIGLESGGSIEIASGLQEGDIVVLTGAYLLNSEYIFKNGADPMAGHNMSDMK